LGQCPEKTRQIYILLESRRKSPGAATDDLQGAAVFVALTAPLNRAHLPMQKGTSAMSMHSSKALVHRLFEEVWNQHHIAVAQEIVHEHYSSIENLVLPSTPGPQIVAAEVELYHALYDGLHFQIERMFAAGDSVVTLWKATGKSKHETFMSRAGHEVPKSLQAEGVSLTEAKDGKITAHRFLWPRKPLFP
jgi:hypothetical protein